MKKNKTLTTIIIVFLLIGLASYVAGLFIDVTRDAGKYATVAKEIYQNSNFINLTVHGEAYDQKPPMLFWLGTAGFYIGNISNFWFKFPVFILVLFGFYWAFKLGESLYNRKVGLLSAFLVFSSFIYSLYSMDIHTDTPLQAFVTLALWQLFEFIKTGKNKHFLWGFIAIGLSMLSKGPIGAAIPAFAVVGHILLKKEFKQFLDYRWYVGIIISLIVVSPALIGLMNQFGWDGLYFFFWENMVGRITGTYINAVNDPIFYVHNLLYQLLPWSILFYIVVFLEFRNLIKTKFRSAEYFTLTGIWIYFIILNSSDSQLPNYIFTIIPLMAVLLAKWIFISIEEARLFKIFNSVQYVVTALLWISVFIIAFYLFPGVTWIYWIIVIMALLSTGYVFVKTDEKLIRLLAPSSIAIFCLFLLLNIHVYPYIFSFQAPPKAARYFTENANENEILYNYRYGQYELFFYSNPQAIQLSGEDLKTVAENKGTWIFTDETGYNDIQGINIKPTLVKEYQHFYLNRGGNFILPKNREKFIHTMYLIRF